MSVKSKIRVELFFKEPSDLREKIQFLASRGVNAFNLVNKSNGDNMKEWVDIIHEELPDSDVCAHFSLKYQKVPRGTIDKHFAVFQEFCTTTSNEILIISGSGKKTKWNSVEALTMLQHSLPDRKIAVAYNPFFPTEHEREAEKDRLLAKLETNQVSKVYLQFGTDLNLIRDSLDFLAAHSVPVAASIFLPTKKLIAQQKFRPWNGVFLNDDFLSGPKVARSLVVQLMKIYLEQNVELLFEAPGIHNDKDMDMIDEMLKEATNDQASDRIPQTKRQKVSPVAEDTFRKKPCILLFGSHDVRLHDNEAIQLASCHSCVLPVFLWEKPKTQWDVTGALQVVLKEALKSLDLNLNAHGMKLVCRNCEDQIDELEKLVDEIGAGTIYYNKCHTTESRSLEKRRRDHMNGLGGIEIVECQSSLLYDPDNISLSSGFNGGHWGTLMPFLKNCKKNHGEPRRPKPRHETFAMMESMKLPSFSVHSVTVSELDMAVVTTKDRWDETILQRFPMSEDAAQQNLKSFFSQGFHRYESERSRADIEWATSKLSAHLRIGTISPNEVYWKHEDSGLDYAERKTFSRRLFWRDLAYYQLLCFPEMREKSIRNHYENTVWVSGEEEKRRFEAWKWGKTGYPIVDAGMRELYAVGWMSQSVRMVVASFLTEYLRVNWVKGCEWFHYTLVDADSAINPMMWQNAGRSGVDQWNFVLSPETASQDRTGAYVRKWIPELDKLPKPLFHRPWQADDETLRRAGVTLGDTYPHRIVDDLKAERAISVENVLVMRRNAQKSNSDRGYDLVELPNGRHTVLFTKKEYRIDINGEKAAPQTMSSKNRRHK